MAKGVVKSGPRHSEPLAIIGFAFEFPSGVTNPESFWQMLVDGKIGLGNVPDDRFNLAAFHETSSGDNEGYFIKNDISAFDAPFFSITAEEAVAMDPQQRLLLQIAYHAFENAGLTLDYVNGSKTSVHVGCLSQDYKVGNNKDSEASPKYTATGDEFTILANRLSWFYNLNGPSMSVETACSSSLVALDLACQLLRNGDTDLGLVAGTSLIHQPDFYIHLDNMGFLSSDNRCHSFDSRANGYARAEGIGVVLVKRLSDAIKDNNTIRTVIRATGSNSDGHTPGITQPSGASQIALIKETYKKAGLSMEKTRYCEAHGTGTPIGDPTESHAIGAAFRASRSSEEPLYVGAVKANIGHMEAASGIAGIIKTILVLERGVIPPIADLVQLNPAIDHTFYRLKFPVKPLPWPNQRLRRASINSFGYGGTNAHVVMDDAYNFLAEHGLKAYHNTAKLPPVIDGEGEISSVSGIGSTNKVNSATTSRPYLLMLSAADRDGVPRIWNIYNEYFKSLANPDDLTGNSALCRQLAFTLDKRRSLLSWRGYTILDPQQLHTADSMTKALSVPTQASPRPCLAFAFTGQGAQWARMGIQYMHYSVFSRSIQVSANYLRGFGCSWDLEEELGRDASNSRVNDTNISQPLSTALQIALVDLLEHINIRPSVVVGHSSGEIAAAYCKGALSQESALKIAYYRGLGGAAEARDPNRNGTMMAVGLGEAEILPIFKDLAARGYEDIYIGCMNSPSNVTVTGDADQLDVLKRILDERGIFVRKVKVPCAYHSPHMIPIGKKYLQQAGFLEPRGGRDDVIPMISYVDGEHVSGERLRELDYWMTNFHLPVRFTDNVGGIDRLAFLAKTKERKKLNLSHRNGMLVTNILEIGPHCALRGLLREIVKTFQHASKTIKYDTVLVRGSTTVEPLLQAVGSLRCSGFNPDISYLNSDYDTQETAPLVDLPSYPFNSSSYWAESRRSKNERFRRRKPSELLGTPTPDWQPFCGTWRNYLNQSKSTWLEDHKIDGVLLYPGAGMISIAIEAMNQYALDTLDIVPVAFYLADVEFIAAMQIPDPPLSLEIHTHLRVLGDTYKQGSWFEFTIFSYQSDLWKLNCRGRVRAEIANNSYRGTLRESTDYSASNIIRLDEFYDKTTKAGYQFGPTFQRINQLQYLPSVPGQLHGVVEVYDRFGSDSLRKRNLRAMDWTHIIHPATLDSILQMTLANIAFAEDAQGSLPIMVPTKVKKLWLSSTGLNYPSSSSLAVTTRCEPSGYEHTIFVTNPQDSNDLKVEITGYEMTIISSKSDASSTSISPADLHVCWNTVWEPLPSALTDSPSASSETEPGTSHGGSQPIVEIYLPSIPSAGATELGTILQLELKNLGYLACKIIDIKQAVSVDNSNASVKVILWDVDRESYLATLSEDSLNVLKRVLNTRSNVLWVKTSDSPSAYIIDGLSRVVRQEQSMLSFATISLTSTGSPSRANAISQVIQALLSEETDGYDVPQTFRETATGGIEVSRLKENKEVTKKVQSVQLPSEPVPILWDMQTSGPLRITIASPGDFDTIHFIEDRFPENLHVDEIEIEVRATGINFKDYLTALGASNEKSIGNEIAGVVTRTGLNVKHLAPGDRVCGVATNGVRTLFRSKAQNFSRIPDSLTFIEAASIPINFATALYTLQNTARLTSGETVLIHRGSGGTGQASIQAAQHLGATVFTTAGNSGKRELLAIEYGIPQSHIFSSRDNNFVAEIYRLNNGRGVDVILNSLPGEQLTGSWECIAPFGRFVEIGRQGVPAGAQLEKNCSFTTVDLAHMYRERPLQVSKLIDEALSLFEKGIFRPLKIHKFSVPEVADALKLIRGRNMSGKVVVEIDPSMRVKAVIAPKQKPLFVSNASYVIAGGLGGLGCDIARWMVEMGARHLVLLSRSGPRTETARTLVADLKNLGVNCVTPSCDISSLQSVKETLEGLIGVVPPVRGCIQASMVLRSALFANMTHTEWSEALAPKVSGSWNLHSLLPEDLDFFILLSSIQGIMGPRTQGNYAAGNTYKDALARYRISRGLKAVSLQLGLMDSDGYMAAAENEDEKRMMLAQNSFVPIERSDFHALLEHYCDATLTLEPDQATLALGIKLLHTNPELDPLGTSWGRDPMFQELRRLEAAEGAITGGTTSKETISQLTAARSNEEAAEVVIKALTEKLASIVYAKGVDADSIDRSKPVQAYGVDSLQTMELRGWFLKTFRSDVPTFEILGAPSLNALALIIGERSTLRMKSA